jgi:uncharacterized protein YijF (DUF1287 family)
MFMNFVWAILRMLNGCGRIGRSIQRALCLLAAGLFFIAPISGCASRRANAEAASAKVQSLARRPISDLPQIKSVVQSAIDQTLRTFDYDPSYAKLDYPGGDIPIERGVCADVIVRAFRSAGVDLQKEVHEDMTQSFAAYPARWGARRPDSNIDHRRVPNLMTFFEREGKSVSITRNSADYIPGDVVSWELENHATHIGLVIDAVADGTPNYLIVHNIGAGARIEDVLMAWKITGHYRMWK